MDSASRYGFINAKLRARIGAMHDSNLIDAMIKAPSLVEAVQCLRDTKHHALVQIYDKTGDIQQVELALLEEEIATYREVASYLSGQSREFLLVMMEKTEIDNIKNCIRLWYASVVRHHAISYRAGYVYQEQIVHVIDWKKILNANSYPEVVAAFKGTPYVDYLSSYSLEKISEEGLFQLEIGLDHIWYSRLFAASSRLASADRIVTENLNLVDVDLKNVLAIIRYAFFHKMSTETMMGLMIPYGKIYNATKKLKKSDVSTLELLQPVIGRYYPEINEEISHIKDQTDSLTSTQELATWTLKIENYLSQRRKKEFMSILTGDPFTIGVVLAYFFIYRQEGAVIRAILAAKYYNWNEDQIREEMV